MPRGQEPPQLVFLDGAVEDGVATIGGVLISNEGVCEAFGAVVPPNLVQNWKTREGQSQVIGQAELFHF